MILKVLFFILLLYGLFMLFAGFTKMKGMIKLALGKLGKNGTEKKAINFMYISGLALLIASVVVYFFAF